METETAIAIVLSIIAILGCVATVGYIYKQPTTDLSGVEREITTMKVDLYNLNKDISQIDDVECNCDIDEDDLEDLEDDIDDLDDDLDDVESFLSCAQSQANWPEVILTC